MSVHFGHEKMAWRHGSVADLVMRNADGCCPMDDVEDVEVGIGMNTRPIVLKKWAMVTTELLFASGVICGAEGLVALLNECSAVQAVRTERSRFQCPATLCRLPPSVTGNDDRRFASLVLSRVMPVSETCCSASLNDHSHRRLVEQHTRSQRCSTSTRVFCILTRKPINTIGRSFTYAARR